MKKQLQRKYSPDDIATMKELRRDGRTWREIASHFRANKNSVVNAYHRSSGIGAKLSETMPKAIRPWPAADFTPDELEVRYS